MFGNPLPRNGLPPCLLDSCPKGIYTNPKSLLPINYHAYYHYQKCLAIGHFPDDEIVKENARTIHRVLTNISEQENQLAILEALKLQGKKNG